MDIAAWLRDLGLERYEQAFQDNDVDAKVLPHLTADDLKDIGITSVGHRRSLLAAIEALRPATAIPEPGASAVGPPAAEPPREAERRQLTVMFVDLVGSTALAGRLDPEDMRAVVAAYHSACAGVITRFEGHVAKFMGDGVLAYFGYPQAHEDDAERAVRAGLEVAQAIGQQQADRQVLAVRIGIATGQVVVGDLVGEGAAQEEAVVGETPNLAARLQGLAPSGSVVIAEGTQKLLGGLFDLADLGQHPLRGFAAPVPVWRVVGESRAEGRFEARHAGRVTPLVGREHELGLLLGRWVQAKDGDGQVMLLSGEPGIGKSRMLEALRERLSDQPHTRLRYFGSPYHTNSAFHPILQQLERAAAFAREDPAEDKLDKLEAILAQGTDRVDTVVPIVASLMSIPTEPRYPPLGLSPERQKVMAQELFLEQLVGLAARQPVLMLLEDAHWVDPTTLEQFDLVIDRIQRLPVLLVVTFRPGFEHPWERFPHITSFSLNRLSHRQSVAMIDRIAGGGALPAEVLDQIVEKADGIPLFIEELAKTVLESDLLERNDVGYRLRAPLTTLAIPSTLHDSLMARLDRLAPVKEVAQIGAVIGREFGQELLAEVSPLPRAELDDALTHLSAAELIFRRGVPPQVVYSFKHALVQEAAYGSLLRGRRQQLHGRIAEVLEDRFPETVEQEPEILARHLSEAGLVERAADAWARAGRAALGRSAMREAAKSLHQAVDLLRRSQSADCRRRELDLLVGLGVALTNTRGPAAPETWEVQKRAERLAEDLGDQEGRFRARWNLWRIHNSRAEFNLAIGIGDRLLAEAERDQDIDHEVQARHTLWSSHMFSGNFETACGHIERGLALYDVERHGGQALVFGGHDARECGLTWGSAAHFLMGYPDRALARSAEGVAHALALGQPQIVSHAHNWGSITLQLARQLEELRRRTDSLIQLAEEHGLTIYYLEARILAAWLNVEERRDRRALAEMREFLNHRAAVGSVHVHTYFLMLFADACLRLGEPDQAWSALEDALERAAATGEHFCTAELYRLQARTCLARDAQARAPAEGALRKSLADARQRLSRMFELRAATDLARLWAEQSRRAEAQGLLAPIYESFTEGFDTADLKDAKVLLHELR